MAAILFIAVSCILLVCPASSQCALCALLCHLSIRASCPNNGQLHGRDHRQVTHSSVARPSPPPLALVSMPGCILRHHQPDSSTGFHRQTSLACVKHGLTRLAKRLSRCFLDAMLFLNMGCIRMCRPPGFLHPVFERVQGRRPER
jgi:hypothetical protein